MVYFGQIFSSRSVQVLGYAEAFHDLLLASRVAYYPLQPLFDVHLADFIGNRYVSGVAQLIILPFLQKLYFRPRIAPCLRDSGPFVIFSLAAAVMVTVYTVLLATGSLDTY